MATAEQLREALSIEARDSAAGKLARQLGRILLAKGYVDEPQLVRLSRNCSASRAL